MMQLVDHSGVQVYRLGVYCSIRGSATRQMNNPNPRKVEIALIKGKGYYQVTRVSFGCRKCCPVK